MSRLPGLGLEAESETAHRVVEDSGEPDDHRHEADAPHGFLLPFPPPPPPEAEPEAADGVLDLLGTLVALGGGADPLGIADLFGLPQAAILDATVRADAVPAGGVGVAYGDTFKLHSLPGSRYVIHLDFDGHTTTGTAWNTYWGNSSFHSPAFSLDGSPGFNEAELLAIQRIWQRVAEYFAPFNINVTTEDPGAAALAYSGPLDTSLGIRVVVTDEGGKNWGGIAYTGSFIWNSDTPAFVYANMLGDVTKSIADAAAHEAGHALGLEHDGRGGETYYWGHTGWAPVMGGAYNAGLVQWSNGAYAGASNAQDDLAIITGDNAGVAYRADDHGNTFSTAGSFTQSVSNGVATVSTYGVITGSGARNDVDMFAFEVAAGGAVDFTVSAWTRGGVSGGGLVDIASPFSMLDIGLALYDSGYRQVAAWNDPARLDGQISLSGLAGGTYYLAVDGVGWGDPLAGSPTGWTEYGSLGQYMIKGSYTAMMAEPPPPPPPPPPPMPALVFELEEIVTAENGPETLVTIRAIGATGRLTAQITGRDPTEGWLSKTGHALTAANDWTSGFVLRGVNDRDADGAIAYTLQATAEGATGASLRVINLDDDIAPERGTLTAMTTGREGVTTVSAAEIGVAEVAKDDGVVLKVVEGGASGGFNLDARWHFAGLESGLYAVQADAWCATENVLLQYSVDGGATWRGFEGAAEPATAWRGDFLARDVAGDLWVRAVDAMRVGDTGRSALVVDLLTVSWAGFEDDVW